MRTIHLALLAACAGITLSGLPARATVNPGDTAPAFRKYRLEASPTPHAGDSLRLADFQGKVLVIFLLGYNCPVCLGNGPAFEADIWQALKTKYPGQVQVIGADVWNGTPSGLNTFRASTGATYPLLLLAAATDGGNMSTLYGPFDNFVVVNKKGIVRYHAANTYPHGDRYHPGEILGCVDSLVTNVADTGGGAPSASRVRLAAAPSPFRASLGVWLEMPASAGPARVAVHDLSGRRVRVLADAALPPGSHRFTWDGRDEAGSQAAAGVYVLRAQAGGVVVQRRVVKIK